MKIVKETLELFLKEATVKVVLELLVPEGADEHLGALRHVDHLRDGPHEGAVHSHQFVVVDLVCLVEDNAYLE